MPEQNTSSPRARGTTAESIGPNFMAAWRPLDPPCNDD